METIKQTSDFVKLLDRLNDKSTDRSMLLKAYRALEKVAQSPCLESASFASEELLEIDMFCQIKQIMKAQKQIHPYI